MVTSSQIYITPEEYLELEKIASSSMNILMDIFMLNATL